MEYEIAKILKQSPIFSSLESDLILSIAKSCSLVNLKPGDILFRAGEPSDCIYLVESGELSAIYAEKALSQVGIIGSGEMFGELGALSGEPRTLTIKALKESQLLKVPAKLLNNLCQQHASVCYAITLPLISRSRSNIKLITTKTQVQCFTILAADLDLPWSKFVLDFQKYVSNFPGVAVVTEEFLLENPSRTYELLAEVEQKYQTIFYLLSSKQSDLVRFCVEKSSTLVWLVRRQCDVEFYQQTKKTIARDLDLSAIRKELILLENEVGSKGSIAGLLDGSEIAVYHRIWLNDSKSYQRFLRIMLGKATALVLGGGGVRGWVHVGVIKAIQELGIEVDVIGGVSIGGLVGGFYAMRLSFDELFDKLTTFLDVSRRALSLRNISWPIISIYNAKKSTQILQDLAAGFYVEDLQVPFFAVSCNLNTNREHVHSHGLLWEIMRATMSLPALVPPMVIDGQIHVDGSILNNLPANIMKDYLHGSENKIIGVMLASGVNDETVYDFPPVMTLKDGLKYKFNLSKKKYRFPVFRDIFMRSLYMGSSSHSHANALSADVLIKPKLAGYGLLEINDTKAKDLFNIGYLAAMSQLKV